MPTYEFVTVDVFTDRRFGGNPLAVFPDARGLSDEQMQALAMEFNLSETTFVLPPDNPQHHAKVRIFTPRSELPFAGHPTLGAAFVLAARHTLCGFFRTAFPTRPTLRQTAFPHRSIHRLPDGENGSTHPASGGWLWRHGFGCSE